MSWLKTSLYLASTRIFGHKSWQVQQSSLNKTNSFLKAVKINGFKANSFPWNRTFSKRLNITVLQLLRCISVPRREAESSQTGSTCYSTVIDELFSDCPAGRHRCIRQACVVRWTISSFDIMTCHLSLAMPSHELFTLQLRSNLHAVPPAAAWRFSAVKQEATRNRICGSWNKPHDEV